MMKKLWPQARPYAPWIAAGVICSAAEAVFELLIPLVMSDIVDIGIENGDADFILRKGALMVVMVLLLINDNRTWRFPFRVRDDMRKKINGMMNNTMLLLTLEIELLFALLCLSMALSWAPPPYLLPGLMAAVIVTVIGGNLMCYAAGGQKKDSGSGSGPSRPSGGSSPLTEPPANSLARRY